jgi:hypothetical protein
LYIAHREINSVIHAAQRCRAKAFRIKVANCRALVVNFYSPIPISKKKQIIYKEAKYMVIKMMWGKKNISIEDVISEKQMKFLRNL